MPVVSSWRSRSAAAVVYTTRAVLDSAGKVVATFDYDAHGQLTGRAGTAPLPFGYGGRPAASATGLVDQHNRREHLGGQRRVQPGAESSPRMVE